MSAPETRRPRRTGKGKQALPLLLPMAAAERSAPPGVKSLRNRLGATQQELADLLQVAASSVHRWEAGRATPDRKTLARLGTLGRLLDLLDPHFRPEGRVEFFRTPQARLDGDRPMDLLGLPSAERRIERLIAALLAGDFS